MGGVEGDIEKLCLDDKIVKAVLAKLNAVGQAAKLGRTRNSGPYTLCRAPEARISLAPSPAHSPPRTVCSRRRTRSTAILFCTAKRRTAETTETPSMASSRTCGKNAVP